MDYRLCFRAGNAVCVYVRHDIMAYFTLALFGKRIINIVNMRAHFCDLRIGYRKPELLFSLRQSDPQPAPGGKLAVVREYFLHLTPGIPPAKRIFINVVHSAYS